jgi:hypothetical protein
VMIIAGPIKLRMVQRRQEQRIRLLIKKLQQMGVPFYERPLRRLRNINAPTAIRIRGQKRISL